jgi:hypothetical protein
MNKNNDAEWIADFRAAVPFPSEARLAAGHAQLVAAVTGQGQAGRRHRAAARPFPRWRMTVALASAAAITAGAAYALTAPASGPAQATAPGRAPDQATLAAKILHAAAAKVAREAATAEPSPGQWIYYVPVDEGGAHPVPTSDGPEWVTFDGGQTAYYEHVTSGPLIVHTNRTSFPPPGTNPWAALNNYLSPMTAWGVLAALPADPHALLAVIAHQVATSVGKQFAGGSVASMLAGPPTTEVGREFGYLTRILWNARLGLGGPPAAEAAVYRAMATLPGITVQQGITDAAGKAAIGISDDGGYNQLLLSPVTYQPIGWRVISDGIISRRPKGTLVMSIASTQVTEVAAPGDR